MATRADSNSLTKTMSEMMATCPLSLQNLPQTIMTQPQLLLPQNAIPIHAQNIESLSQSAVYSLGIGGGGTAAERKKGVLAKRKRGAKRAGPRYPERAPPAPPRDPRVGVDTSGRPASQCAPGCVLVRGRCAC